MKAVPNRGRPFQLGGYSAGNEWAREVGQAAEQSAKQGGDIVRFNMSVNTNMYVAVNL